MTRGIGHSCVVMVLHVVWSTRLRRKALTSASDAWLEECLRDQARHVDGDVLAFGAGDDHVHLLVRLHPTLPLSRLVQQLKGATAHAWNQHGQGSTPLEWQRGYWAESCNPRDITDLAAYVRSQRERHTVRPEFEEWECVDQD